ncbi:rhomboid family intramembrane serine protease [Limnobacter sp.]|uniref:rhomboid family intramembrane serine protease n=1 Tax=Limnobacter sp. TaxID=2003368 RepID=UPI003516DF29
MLTQFIHLSWTHLALNLAGLAVLTWGFSHLIKPSLWAGLLGLSLAWVALYITFIEPLSWYCGLSGALHMQFVVCLALAFRQSTNVGLRAWPLWLMLLGLLAKLLLELNPAEATDPSVGGPVAYAAHRGGALGGLLVVIILATPSVFKKFGRRV